MTPMVLVMDSDLAFENITDSKEHFAADNVLEYITECGNLNSANSSICCDDKIYLEGDSNLQHGIYLVTENSPYERDTQSQEIVVNDINHTDSKHWEKPPEFKKSTVNFNIKVRKRKGCRKGKMTNAIANDDFTRTSFVNHQQKSDLFQIVSNVRKKRNEGNELVVNSVKRIMLDNITRQFRLVDTQRDSSNKSINFDKSNLYQNLGDSKKSSTLPVSPRYSHLTMKDWEADITEENGSIQDDFIIKEIKFIKGINPKQIASNSRNTVGKNSPSKSAKIVYWMEGNIDTVNEPIYLSSQLIRTFSQNLHSNSGSCGTILDDSSSNLTNEKVFSNIHLSWQSVKERIEELEDEAQTRFISYYKTPTFKENPQPFKKIQFEMNAYRKEHNIVIPFTGVPFIFIGICIFSCHLGKIRKSNERLCGKINNSKKIGCPATLSVVKIARFPDFDISSLSTSAMDSAITELKNAWDIQNPSVRYYIEYCMKEPKISDHKFHEICSQNNKFQEPVDPRILNRIHLLTKQGITSTRKMELLISSFIKYDLFNGEDVPSDRRRYNPTMRDVQYNIHKAKEEMRKEGRNITQEQCVNLANEISSTVMNINNEQYLQSIKAQLDSIAASLKEGDLNVNFFSSQQDGNNSDISATRDPSCKPNKSQATVSSARANENLTIDRAGSSNVPNFEQDLDFLFESPSIDMSTSTNPENRSFYLSHELAVSPHELAVGLQNHVENFQGEHNDDNTERLLYLIRNGTSYHN